ncbi:hypothetical protein HUJ04_008195 [Dendroctonus ponderosae]|nr:hypothetical protein HUJ04_008195 [Dendroctonus ponderosae]
MSSSTRLNSLRELVPHFSLQFYENFLSTPKMGSPIKSPALKKKKDGLRKTVHARTQKDMTSGTEDDTYGTHSNQTRQSRNRKMQMDLTATGLEYNLEPPAAKAKWESRRQQAQRALQARDAIIRATSLTYAGGKKVSNSEEQRIVKENVQELTDILLDMISQEEPENEGNIRKLLERQTTAMKEMRREIQGLRATVEEDRKQLQKAPYESE